jgi:hypothetical protein
MKRRGGGVVSFNTSLYTSWPTSRQYGAMFERVNSSTGKMRQQQLTFINDIGNANV